MNTMKGEQLSERINALEALVSELSMNANNNKKNAKTEKKPRNMTDKGAYHKAKLLFYQENKNEDEVKLLFKENYGKDLTVSFGNWTMVKKITDILFEELSDSEKEKYIKMVKN